MRDRFPGVVVGALLLAGATLAFLQRGAARGRFAQALSTYRSEPDLAAAPSKTHAVSSPTKDKSVRARSTGRPASDARRKRARAPSGSER